MTGGKAYLRGDQIATLITVMSSTIKKFASEAATRGLIREVRFLRLLPTAPNIESSLPEISKAPWARPQGLKIA